MFVTATQPHLWADSGDGMALWVGGYIVTIIETWI